MYDPTSVYYNYLLAISLCKIQNTSNYFTLPKAPVNTPANFKAIIKYNNNILPRTESY
jgi:hypothetical protein